jgi:hypothetical protein
MRYEKIKNKAPWEKVILDEGEVINGYKAMNKNWTCQGHKYETGVTYHHDGPPTPCKSGYHFCLNVVDCFAFYDSTNCIIVKVEAWGTIIKDATKLCAEYIRIGEELEPESIYDLSAHGDWNSGYGNSGYRNSGDMNSGYWNSGNGNSGDWNSGYGNSGYRNSGYANSGYWNSGNMNSGYGNATNFSSGIFCTIEPKALIFDAPSDMTLDDWNNSRWCVLCDKIIERGSVDGITGDEWKTLAEIPNWDREKFITCLNALWNGGNDE